MGSLTHIIRESRTTTWWRMEDGLEDMDQDESAASHFRLGERSAVHRTQRSQKELLDDHTQRIIVTWMFSCQRRSTSHQSRSIRISAFQCVLFLNFLTTSLHTDWLTLRVAVSSHAPCRRRGHVVHESPVASPRQIGSKQTGKKIKLAGSVSFWWFAVFKQTVFHTLIWIFQTPEP